MNLNNYLISYRTLRRLIGVLGVLLPFLCWGVNAFVNHFDLLNNPVFVNPVQSDKYVPGAYLKPSVSHFYYTAAGPLLTGILISVSVFLFCYVGYPENKEHDRFSWLTDRRVTTVAAISALGIVVFPASSEKIITDNIHIFVSSGMAGNVHLIFAALFFLAMALMSIFNFRRHPGRLLITDAEGKVYLCCGWGILFCLLMLSASFLFPAMDDWFGGRFVFVMEVIMLILFGIAWLVKGKSSFSEYFLQKTRTDG